MQAMEGFGRSTYGDRIADVYDRMYRRPPFSGEETADGLASLAGGGRALELAIGTGRVALPLASRGVEVHGIDASEAMVAKLRARPGGDDIPVTIGDFADVQADGRFDLVYVAFNTFFALTTADDQQRCVRNVAGRLVPGGRFAVEAFVPDLARYDRGQRVCVTGIQLDEVQLDASLLDEAGQRIETQHIVISETGIRLFPVVLRYLWPEQLDAMADAAGLHLQHRWSGWGGEPFTAESGFHVSVYARPT